MTATQQQALVFLQIHIEAARNSTDDFNLFHDKHKWQRIRANPFGGPIALGFQLECLIEYQSRCHRLAHGEDAFIAEHGLNFSNYQFVFADVVRPGSEMTVDIRRSQQKTGAMPQLGNRVMLKAAGKSVLIGHKKETTRPTALPDADLHWLPTLRQLPDRSYLEDGAFFLKRKFMNVGNAKNFLSGSLAEQADYFDELAGRIDFPEIFPASLMSCALLERALSQGHDFENAPMVYTSHHISIDRRLLHRLGSNDRLHILVRAPREISAEKGLGKSALNQSVYECFGVLDDGGLLYRAEMALASLDEILGVGKGPD